VYIEINFEFSFKEVLSPDNNSRTNQNVSDLENVESSGMSESRNYINDEISSLKERVRTLT